MTELTDQEFTKLWLNHQETENCPICAERARRFRKVEPSKDYSNIPHGVAINERNKTL